MRLLSFLGDAPAGQSGRADRRLAQQLGQRPGDRRSATSGRTIVATEFVGTSISSGGDGFDFPAGVRPVLADNPFVKFYNEQRGYVSCEITPEAMRANFRVLDYVTEPGGSCSTRATFVVENGRPGANRDSRLLKLAA